MTWDVLITCPQLQASIGLYRDLLLQRGVQIELPQLVQQLNESQLLEIIDRFDGVIAGDDEFTGRVLEAGNRLKVISRWGIGMDAVNLDVAHKLDIRVMNTPDVFSDEVADIVMGYLILLSRKLHRLDQSVRSGGWANIQGISLRDKTLGVIGVGNIGCQVSRRAHVAGMTILGHDIFPPPPEVVEETGLRVCTLDELLESSDFISLNCNLTAVNRHMIGAKEFEIMKTGVYLINVARGPLIDEQALIYSLDSGKVAGAALDVFEQEPLPSDSRLRSFGNCIFGTHNASNSYEAVLRTNQMSIDNLLGVLEGQF